MHRHIYQDVYEHAGELRTTELSKDETNFARPQDALAGMHDVHQRLKDLDFLQGVSREEFANQAGIVMGDINHLHPFRTGNGTTQLQYLKDLGEQAGFDVALERLNPDDWKQASIDADNLNYRPMQDCILGITTERSHERSRSHDRERDR